jgi:hypothetical protein
MATERRLNSEPPRDRRPPVTPRPSIIYRRFLKTGLVMLTTYEELKVLLGRAISDLTMDDLEAFWVLVFGTNPRRHAPPGYNPRRG